MAKFTKFSAFVYFFSVLAFSSISTSAVAEDVHIYTYNLKPFHFNHNGKSFGREFQVNGALSGFVKEWFDAANVSYKMELRAPKERSLSAAERVDNGAVFLLPKTDEMMEKYDFIGPITSLSWGVFQIKESGKKELAKISASKLLLESRSEINDDLKKLEIRGRTYSRQRDIVNIMRKDDSNLWALELIEAQRINKAFPNLGLSAAFLYKIEDLYLVVDKNVPQYKRDALSLSLAKLQQLGRIDELLIEYIHQ
jgi:hypothetical protein